MKYITDNILSWCNEPEQGAIDQALNLSKHPALIGNVCLMPDTHQGYGMPIGGVVALKDAVCPNMVGVDIGCGMLAVKTSITEWNTEQLKSVMEKIRETIPVGFNHRKKEFDHPVFSEVWSLPICGEQFSSAKKQIGTLGGGNHFIELQKGDDGHLWFMIHSGSRNLGKQVADYYNKIAERLCLQFHNDEVVRNELAYIPIDTSVAQDYIDEMNLCLKFSYANRQVMSQFIKEAITSVFDNTEYDSDINIHHNYAALENHYGQNVWVHRKGATLARENTIGLIPGSQGTCSYVVRGLGNEESLQSCSHGAGRKMSRSAARKNLNVQDEIEKMESQGIIHAIRSVDDLDESASAYKDIDDVMESQKDLVEIITKLTPLGVIKG